MNLFFEQIKQHNAQREPGVVVVVGAGHCSELPGLRLQMPQRLILIEAHAQQAEELDFRIQAERGEEVWPVAAVAEHKATAQFYQLNNLAESGLLRPASGLIEHFPNVRQVGEVTVPAKNFAGMLEGLHADSEKHNVLLLDVPGQVLDLLRQTPALLLQAFPTIAVRSSVVPLYEGDAGAPEIQAALFDLGYDALGEAEGVTYPHFLAWFARNDDRIELLRLEQNMRKQAERAALQLQAMTKERDSLAATLEIAAKEQVESQGRVETLESEVLHLKQRLASAAAEFAGLAATRDELLLQRQQAQEELALQRQSVSDWQQRYEALEAQRKTELAELHAIRNQSEAAMAEAVQFRHDAEAAEERVLAEQKQHAEVFAELSGQYKQALAEISAHQQAAAEWALRAREYEQQQTEVISLKAKLAEEVARQEQASLQAEELAALRKQYDTLQHEFQQLRQSLAKREQDESVLRLERDTLRGKTVQQEQELTERRLALQQQQQQMSIHEANSGEIALRQQRLQDELLKAEGQIDLIKDLLLHDLGV